MSGWQTIASQNKRLAAVERGEACQGCGLYFNKDHGKRTWCRHCWDRLSVPQKLSKKNRKQKYPDFGD